MEFNTVAYLPFNLDENFTAVIIAEKIHLLNDEIIALTLNQFGKECLKGISKRQKYKIEFLDKYHTDINKAERYAKITYEVLAGNKESVFVKISETDRQNLMWMNKMYWIQKDNYVNLKWIVSVSISIIALLFSVFG